MLPDYSKHSGREVLIFDPGCVFITGIPRRGEAPMGHILKAEDFAIRSPFPARENMPMVHILKAEDLAIRSPRRRRRRRRRLLRRRESPGVAPDRPESPGAARSTPGETR